MNYEIKRMSEFLVPNWDLFKHRICICYFTMLNYKLKKKKPLIIFYIIQSTEKDAIICIFTCMSILFGWRHDVIMIKLITKKNK